MRNLSAPFGAASQNRRKKIVAAAVALLAVPITAVIVHDASAALGTAAVPTDGVGYPGSGTTYSLDIEVFDEETIDNTVFVAGKFTKVYDRSAGTWIDQKFLAAFDGTTGEFVKQFRPRLEGPAYSLDAVGKNLLVGGEFHSINGMPETESLAMINPATNEVVPTWVASLNKTNEARAKVQDMWVTPQWTYLAGNFAKITGGQIGQSTTVTGLTGIARVRTSDGRPDSSWKPQAVGPVWTIAASADGQRVHIGGNFNSVAGQGPNLATVKTTDGTAVPGWDVSRPSTWTANVNTKYWRGLGWAVFDLDVYGNNLWIGGAEHGYASKRSDTGQTWFSKGIAHDSQRVKVFGDKVYIGCHCHSVTTGNTATDLPFFELNAATGAQTSVFSKDLDGADAGWAITKTPDGCLWPGGDFRSAAKADGSRFFVGGFTKICDAAGPVAHNVPPIPNQTKRDTQAPTAPAGLTVTNSGGKPLLNWSVSTDDRTELAYRVYRDGSLLALTRYPTFLDSVAATEPHTYVVVAYDPAGHTSAASNVVKVNGGSTNATPLAAPVVVTQPTVYDGRIQFAIEPTASNVASVQITKDGQALGNFRSDELAPLANLAIGKPATMSSRGDANDLAGMTDGTCCSGVNYTTSASTNPWAEVDLGASRQIESVDHMVVGLSATAVPMNYIVSEQPMTGLTLAQAKALPGATTIRTQSTGASLLQPIFATGRYIRFWAECSSCALRVAEMRVWGGSERAPIQISVPGGEGTYYATALGIDGRASTPTPIVVNSTSGRALVSWTETETVVARQSSTYAGGVASRAIDGKLDGTWAGLSVAHTGNSTSTNLGRVAGVTARSSSTLNATSTATKALDGTTTGTPTSGTAFGSLPGTPASNLLRAAGVTVSETNPVNGAAATRAVDGTTNGDAAVGSVATAGPVGGGALPAGTVTNLARVAGATAKQSSDFGPTWPASAAIDGNTTSVAGSIAYTKRYEAGWWEIDLGASRQISNLQIWPRTDERWWFASKVRVFTSDAPFSGTSLAELAATPGVTSFDITSTPTQGQKFTVGRTGRYIHIHRLEADAFSVAEIAVNGTAVAAASTRAHWDADLGASTAMSTMTLWPRTDCCAAESATLRAFFSNSPFTTEDPAALAQASGVTSRDIAAVAGAGTAITTPANARYVRIQQLGTGNLSLAEVSITGQAVNQWWEADLGTAASIGTIVVSPRSDCCATESTNYWVYVSATPFTSETPAVVQATPGVKVIPFTGTGTAQLPVGVTGRYVRIQKADASALSLAEVQIMSPTTLQWWEADLGASRHLQRIRLYPRTDCCSDRLANVRVMYSDVPFASDDPAEAIKQPGVTYRDILATPTVGQKYWVGRHARYVRVQRLTPNYLNIAEIGFDGLAE